MISSKLQKTVNNCSINITLRKRGVGESYSEYVKRGNRGNIRTIILSELSKLSDYPQEVLRNSNVDVSNNLALVEIPLPSRTSRTELTYDLSSRVPAKESSGEYQ